MSQTAVTRRCAVLWLDSFCQLLAMKRHRIVAMHYCIIMKNIFMILKLMKSNFKYNFFLKNKIRRPALYKPNVVLAVFGAMKWLARLSRQRTNVLHLCNDLMQIRYHSPTHRIKKFILNRLIENYQTSEYFRCLIYTFMIFQNLMLV